MSGTAPVHQPAATLDVEHMSVDSGPPEQVVVGISHMSLAGLHMVELCNPELPRMARMAEYILGQADSLVVEDIDRQGLLRKVAERMNVAAGRLGVGYMLKVGMCSLGGNR